MNINECRTIYEAACKANACEGNIQAAKRYLDAGDVEGFERVCRGNWQFLQDNGIEYSLTNGMREY